MKYVGLGLEPNPFLFALIWDVDTYQTSVNIIYSIESTTRLSKAFLYLDK